MATDFKLLEFELYGLLLKAKELLASLPDSGPMADKLDEELERIKTKKYNVAVVGEFRRGKSSLINALLGLPVLPADATPTTATVNRITYGAEPSVTIHYKDGSQKKLDSLEELPNYVTKLSAEREAVAKTVREAVVEYPIVICQNHVDIIDTPGLSDDEEMTRVTIGLLQNIDAAIVAVSALAPFAESEKKFVAQLIANPGVTHILFVVTFIDQIDPEEYDRIFEGIKNRIRQMVLAQVKEQYGQEQWILEKAGRILDEPSIFGVSSRKALKAFVGNDRRMLEESRFPPFKQALYAILTARQSVNMAEKAVHALREAAAWEQAQHTEREQTLQQQLGCLEGLPGLVEDYCAGAVKSMDALLAEAAGRIARPGMDAGAYAEKLASFFIQELAQVKEGSNETIQHAVMTGALHAAEVMQEESERISGQMLGSFEGVADAYGARRDAFLDRAAACGLDTGIWKEQYGLRMKTQLAGVPPLEFGWAGPLWPNAKRLLDCNVIETICSGIRQALSEWERSAASYLRALRAALFAAARQEAESMPSLLRSAGDNETMMRGKLAQLETEHQEHARELSELAAQGTALLAGLYQEEG